MRKGQPELKGFLNTAIQEQQNLGTIDRLVTKYEPVAGTFYRLSPAFTMDAAR
jgi:ABC-type amino acid transport substrate-binding protein